MGVLTKTKRWIKCRLIFLRDVKTGVYFRFAKRGSVVGPFEYSIEIVQEIKPSETFENKLFNIRTVIAQLNEYVLYPNEVLSFWRIVGNPEKGLKKSRSITKGQLTEEIGGGICQVSGAMYHLSLLSGLEVLERYNHSVDLYTEETRFTPLGTDATVVYGNKDLRLKNTLSFPVKFELSIADNKLIARICSLGAIKKWHLSYEVEELIDKKVAIIRDENKHVLCQSVYSSLK